MNHQTSGTVKWYNPDKAYGFITLEDGRDIFVHMRAIADGRPWLVDGQGVALSVREGPKGLEAVDVRVVRDVDELPPSRIRSYTKEAREARALPAQARPRREREHYQGPLPTGPVAATVLHIDASGRFMFVRADAEGFDVYVHRSLFSDAGVQVRAGDQVRVTVEQSERGLRARSLQLR